MTQSLSAPRADLQPVDPVAIAVTAESAAMAATAGSAATASAAGASGSLTRQGSRFTVIGSAGTGLQLGLYAVLAAILGAQIASAVSWLLSTVVTNRFHRALTFQVHEHEHSGSDQTVAFATSLAGLGITSVVLAQLADASGLAGVIAILAVNTIVGAGRFFGMRWWLGGAGRHIADAGSLLLLAAKDNFCLHRTSLHH